MEDNASKAMRELSKDSLDATCALDEAQRTQQSKQAFQEALNAERTNKTAQTDDDAIHSYTAVHSATVVSHEGQPELRSRTGVGEIVPPNISVEPPAVEGRFQQLVIGLDGVGIREDVDTVFKELGVGTVQSRAVYNISVPVTTLTAAFWFPG